MVAQAWRSCTALNRLRRERLAAVGVEPLADVVVCAGRGGSIRGAVGAAA